MVLTLDGPEPAPDVVSNTDKIIAALPNSPQGMAKRGLGEDAGLAAAIGAHAPVPAVAVGGSSAGGGAGAAGAGAGVGAGAGAGEKFATSQVCHTPFQLLCTRSCVLCAGDRRHPWLVCHTTFAASGDHKSYCCVDRITLTAQVPRSPRQPLRSLLPPRNPRPARRTSSSGCAHMAR